MLNKSRYTGATSQRQYDIPGASLRGPYKRWIPQADSHLSESESELPRPSSRRPSGHHASSGHGTKVESSIPTPPISTSRNPAGNTSQYNLPPQQHRSEHQSHGYSSESTIHAPPPPIKSSGFNIFRSHNKEAKGHSSSTHKREDASRSTMASSSRHPTAPPLQTKSNRDHVTSVPAGAYDSYSTPSSSDPSPRSSTDSGPRNGHVSAPPAENFEARRNGQTMWNPYVETKLYSSSRKPYVSSSSRREDGKRRDKEDMTTKVMEALGNGSTTKTRASDNMTQQVQNQPTKVDDISSIRRTAPSTATLRGMESSSGVQVPLTFRRTKATSPDTPHNNHAYLPESATKNSHPLLLSSRTSVEPQSRVQNLGEASGKSAPATSKPPASSAPTSTPKLPHSRTASSPWPFNQALPTEQVSSPKIQAQVSSSHNHYTSWKSFSRLHGSSTTKTTDVRSSSKDTTSNTPTQDPSRSSQGIVNVSSSSRSLPRSSAIPTSSSRTGLPVSTSTSTPIPSNQYNVRTRHDAHTSYTTIPTEQPQRVVNDGAGKPVPPSAATPQIHAVSHYHDAPPTRPSGINITTSVAPDIATTAGRSERYPHKDTLPPLPINGNTPSVKTNGSHTPPDSIPIGSAAVSRPTNGNDPSSAEPEPDLASYPDHITFPTSTTSSQTPSAMSAATHITQQTVQGSQPQWYTVPPPTNPATGLFSLTSRYASMSSQAVSSPPAGIWNSNGASSLSNAGISYASQGFSNSSAVKPSQSGSRSNPPTPPEHDTPVNPNTDKLATLINTTGPWSKFSNTNLSAVTSEDVSTPKATRNNAFGEEIPILIPKLVPGIDSSPEQIIHAELYQPMESASYSAPIPGAWTTSSRYATNASGSVSHSAPFSNSSANVRENSITTRQAILGTTPVAGAWTTKSSLPNPPLATSDSPSKLTPPRNPSPSLKPPPPSSSGTGTGSSTPSSTQPSDAHSSVKAQSTRVPISGHPSTPAPVRPVLRPTPPPLSISSTLPDTDSLLTPSSLNSPRSTILLPQSVPTAPVTVSSQGQRKAGFFDFLRPKPTPYEVSKPSPYEVWVPPNRDKDRKRDSSPKASVTTSSGSKTSVPVPIPRPKSPKIFSPFKLFSRRHRTVSTASLDVLDGTAANTLMNSPASSMRAETPGAPPSPPLRDAILATQEWRNREANDLIQSGRKRRHRPGVTFDCPEDIAPADIIPTRLRVPRLLEDDADY